MTENLNGHVGSPDPTIQLPATPVGDDATMMDGSEQRNFDANVSTGTEQTERIAPDTPGTIQFAPDGATLDGNDALTKPALAEMPDESGVDDLVPGYEMLGELGRGGMGVVYKARHRRLNRIVALKMILAGGHASATELTRFLTEAEAVASMQHPNIVQIFETGRCNDLPYFTLEYMEGGSLTAMVKDHPLTAAKAAAIVEPLARAMHYAHGKGVIHRDLKPDNVLFAGDRTPKVTDFGLAKKIEGGSGTTQTGAIMGTPSYMAPEQADGRTKFVGPAADIYALGAILYRLVTGRPPFQAATPLETVLQVVKEDPVPPSRLLPKLSRDLETICMKCLEKDPARRYVDAAALADDLARFQRGEPVHARPVRAWERWVRWARRHPSTAALLAVLIVVVTVVPLYFVVQHLSERRRVARLEASALEEMVKGKEAIARSDWQSAQLHFDQARKSLESEPELSEKSSEAAEFHAHARRRLAAQETLALFGRRRNEALLDAARSVGSGSAARQRTTIKKIETALSAAAVNRDELTPLSLPPGFNDAERDAVVAGCYELTLVLAEAFAQPLLGQAASERPQRLETSLRLLDRAATLGYAAHPTQAYHRRRARYLEQLGRTEASKQERQTAQRRPATTTLDHYLVGDEMYKEGDPNAAASSFEIVLRLDPAHFWARYFLALCELRRQRPDLAQAHLTACLSQNPEPSIRAWILLMRGYALGQLGRSRREDLVAAELDFETALQVLNQPEGERDRDAEYALYNNRGVMRIQNQQFDRGVADLLEAIRANPRQHHAHVSLSMAYQQAQRLSEAAAELGRAIEIAKALADGGELSSAEVAHMYRGRAQVHLERWQEQGRRSAVMSMGPVGGLATTASALMSALALMGEPRESARADLESALAILEKTPGSDAAVRAKINIQLGRLFQFGESHRDAVAAFERAIRCEPNQVEAHRRLAQSLLKLGRLVAAETAFTHYFEWCRQSGSRPASDAYLARGLIREQLGRPEGAVEDYTQSLATEPKNENGQTLARRGRAYLQSNKPQLALLDFDAALQLQVATSETQIGRGYALARLARFDDAIAAVGQSLRIGPRTPSLLHAAARIHALALSGLEAGQWRPAGGSALDRMVQILDLLEEALRLAEPRAAVFWRDAISEDRTFASIRRTSRFREFEERYASELIARAESAMSQAGSNRADDLLDAARTFVHVAEQSTASTIGSSTAATALRQKAVDAIRRALSAVPESERRTFWRETIEPAAIWRSLREVPEFDQLRIEWGARRPSFLLPIPHARPWYYP